MTYIIRDSTGQMIMKVNNFVAQQMIKDISGEFYRYKAVGMPTAVNAFRTTAGATMHTNLGEIYIWEGTKLIPE